MIEAWFDGACEPRNPGGHAAWGVFIAPARELYGYVGHGSRMSNNVAEYTAAAEALRALMPQRGEEIVLRGDSQLVVEQLNGRWKVRGGLYLRYYEQAHALTQEFTQLSIKWVPREQNTRADALSKKALAERGVATRTTLD